MEMVVADMVPDNPGTWLFHCHFFDHSDGGMQALFTVRPKTTRVARAAAP
jgi:FtsP/CotA-like multicopper oxidase with cupredoxin domain